MVIAREIDTAGYVGRKPCPFGDGIIDDIHLRQVGCLAHGKRHHAVVTVDYGSCSFAFGCHCRETGRYALMRNIVLYAGKRSNSHKHGHTRCNDAIGIFYVHHNYSSQICTAIPMRRLNKLNLKSAPLDVRLPSSTWSVVCCHFFQCKPNTPNDKLKLT